MHLPTKITMSCLRNFSVKSLASRVHKTSISGSYLSVQNFLYTSKVVSDQRRNSLIAGLGDKTKDTCHFSTVTKPHFPKKIPSVLTEKRMHGNTSALQIKKRVPRKRLTSEVEQVGRGKWLAAAYSSAEKYDLNELAKGIKKNGVYKILPFPDDEVLHVTANYQVEKEPRHIYFFNEGSVVFWNVPDIEQHSVIEFLKPFQRKAFDENLCKEEKEDMDYLYGENGTKLSNGVIVLKEGLDVESLETYAFSNGLALSVKLAMWEARLENFTDQIEWVMECMESGKKIQMSREQVFQKRGELFSLRHAINIGSDLLDTPDFYWDRDELEILYRRTCNYLNIAKRTKVVNERLNYSSELIDLLGSDFNDKHHVRLELMIIALIMIEVMFECLHFFG